MRRRTLAELFQDPRVTAMSLLACDLARRDIGSSVVFIVGMKPSPQPRHREPL